MAADDAGDSGGGVQVQIVDGVDQVEETAGEFDSFGVGELGAGAVGVDVAADGGHGGDGAQGVEDGGIADVTGVEDVIDDTIWASQGGEDLGAEETVGVGEYAEEHGLQAGGEACAGVEDVAQGVAYEVERQDGEHDGEGGEDDHVG